MLLCGASLFVVAVAVDVVGCCCLMFDVVIVCCSVVLDAVVGGGGCVQAMSADMLFAVMPNSNNIWVVL